MKIEYTNPLIVQRADPHIFKYTDGTYYFTATKPEYDGILLRSSKTIEGLKDAEEIIVWVKHESGPMSHYIWAPEIHYVDGAFCIYFAAKGVESLDHTISPHKIFVIRCEGNPMTDSWNEEGAIDTGWNSFSLDATTFAFNKKRYLVWAQMFDKIESNSNIYIAEMSDYKTLKLPAVCLSKPEFDWEIVGFKVNEGPAVIHIDNQLILTYSASATDFNYCVGMLTLDDTKNPLDAHSWVKASQPILSTNETIGEYGPGHNNFTLAEDNETVLFVYHARSYRDIIGDPLHDHNRHCRVKVFDFWKRFK